MDENLSLTCSSFRDGERKEENGKETLEIFLYSSTPEFFRRKGKITRKKDSKISSQKWDMIRREVITYIFNIFSKSFF